MSNWKDHKPDNISEERFTILKDWNDVVLFGGNWNVSSNSGSRDADWYYAPSGSNNSVSARGVCDHLKVRECRRKSQFSDVKEEEVK